MFHSLLYNFVSCPATLSLKACLTYLHSEEMWSVVTESKHSGVILVQVLTSVCWDPNPPNRDTATYLGSNLVVENKSKSVSAFLFLFGNNRTSVPKPPLLVPTFTPNTTRARNPKGHKIPCLPGDQWSLVLLCGSHLYSIAGFHCLTTSVLLLHPTMLAVCFG